MIYRCCSEARKSAILANSAITLNGIDYLEVLDQAAIALNSPRQRTLLVHCLKPPPTTLALVNVLITGGESITGIHAQWIAPAVPAPPLATAQESAYFNSLADAANVLVIRTNECGDFAPYVLRLVNNATVASEDSFQVTEVLSGFDPQLAEVQFSFKIECGPNFDCGAEPADCPPVPQTPPPINYLAKDYGSFRTLILDRLNQLLPSWGGANVADPGVMLAELIAYQGDYLSYRQDAISTEAYLETARSRVSLRRHALLVDYRVHDGCNARAWIHLEVAGNTGQAVFLDRTQTRFYTYAPGMPPSLAVGAGNEEAALASGVQVFEPMQDANLYPEHNSTNFYTWGDSGCCLPQGATEATLSGSFPNLQPGSVLIFQEVLGPQTGNAADADLRHRCAVRLTQVATQDAKGNSLVDPLFDATGKPIAGPSQTPAPVTEIQWSQDDALPFPVCISSTYLDSNGVVKTATNVSVVHGNVVLAAHGLSFFPGKSLGVVPQPRLYYPAAASAGGCELLPPSPLPVRYRPAVPDSPITQAVPLALAGSPVTPSVVLLAGTGAVGLTDANGFVCLTAQAGNPSGWPQFFGVLVKQNQTTAGDVDLSVVYNPPAGAAGSRPPITLESFPNLSLNPKNTNYAVSQINSLSRLIRVPSTFVSPTTAPAGFPATPTMLSNSGPVNLQDLSNPALTFLIVQPTNPAGWLQDFGVLAQAVQPATSPGGWLQDFEISASGVKLQPPTYNLSVVYSPPSGGEGVTLPVTLEQFDGLTLATISGQFNSNSQLITVKSFAEAPDPGLSAYDLMNFDPGEAVPEIALQGTFEETTSFWMPEQDLLESAQTDRVFVVEVESDGSATLRFATPPDPSSPLDGNGMVPDPGTAFTSIYRIGNGSAGNVGAETLVYLARSDARIQSCTNPMPATGGVDPETNDQIRRRAPQAFLTQERSVTMTDYEAIAEASPQVDQAVASLRWTGSWYSVFIAVEPKGAGNLTPTLQKTLQQNLERYRLAGQDLKLESPQYVSLQITLNVCVDPNYFQSDVEQALLQVLGNGILPDGRKGLFYPDNFTFGQSVYLSPVYAAARSVPGVTLVKATQFQPQGVNSTQYLTAGQIKLGSLQVARLDNDPSYPDHGQLTLDMQGGK